MGAGKLSKQQQGKDTQGDYRYLQKLAGTKRLLKNAFTKEEFEVLEKYEIVLVKEAKSDATRVKNFDMIWGNTKLLNGKNWLKLTQRDIDQLVIDIMDKYGKNGKETATSSDRKRFLKIWYRFVKYGIRDFKEAERVHGAGDPIETRGIVAKNVVKQFSPDDMITLEEKKKIIDACPTLRDKALIDLAFDSGKRIDELLTLKIKMIQVTDNGYRIKAGEFSKTGMSSFVVLDCVPTLAKWLESHPNLDDPEAWVFPNMKHIWKGNKQSYAGARNMLLRAKKEAGVKKRIYFHLFRHTAVTNASKYMPEALLKDRYAWSPDSKMPSRYTHIQRGIDADNAYLKARGIEPKTEDLTSTVPVPCPICKTPNSHDSKLCQSCGKPMSTEMAVLFEDEKENKVDKLESQLQNLVTMLAPVLDLVSSTKPIKIPMKYYPKEVQREIERKFES